MGLHYQDQRGEEREDLTKKESGSPGTSKKESSSRPVIILRNVCEICGHSFDGQYVFYKHLKEHYDPDFIPIGYHPEIPEAQQEDVDQYAKEEEDGFVNEQFEEIFANNINNKSPDMIEHLEIFIKNQESRTETIDGMMILEDPRASSPQNLREFVEEMGKEQELEQQREAELIVCGNVPQQQHQHHHQQAFETHRVIYQDHGNHHTQQLVESILPIDTQTTPGIIEIEDEKRIPLEEEEEEEEHFADISSLPSYSPPPPPVAPEEEERVESPEREIFFEDPSPINLAKTTNDQSDPMTVTSMPSKTKKSYPCRQCPRKFESSTALKYHETTHDKRKVHCEYCDKMFLTKSTLAIHLRIHLESRPYDCSHCELRFRQKTDLNYHIASRHTAKSDYRFKCEFCDKKFARKYSLNLHTKLHTGEKNYTCEVCLKSFRASSYLQVHLRSHTGERPYQCSVSECNKRFAVKADVRRHIKQVHGEPKKASAGGGEGTSSGTPPKKRKTKKKSD